LEVAEGDAERCAARKEDREGDTRAGLRNGPKGTAGGEAGGRSGSVVSATSRTGSACWWQARRAARAASRSSLRSSTATRLIGDLATARMGVRPSSCTGAPRVANRARHFVASATGNHKWRSPPRGHRLKGTRGRANKRDVVHASAPTLANARRQKTHTPSDRHRHTLVTRRCPLLPWYGKGQYSRGVATATHIT